MNAHQYLKQLRETEKALAALEFEIACNGRGKRAAQLRMDALALRQDLNAFRDEIDAFLNPSLFPEAYALAIQMLTDYEELEIRSALKQCASDCGIPSGDVMGQFVHWAEKKMGVAR